MAVIDNKGLSEVFFMIQNYVRLVMNLLTGSGGVDCCLLQHSFPTVQKHHDGLKTKYWLKRGDTSEMHGCRPKTRNRRGRQLLENVITAEESSQQIA